MYAATTIFKAVFFCFFSSANLGNEIVAIKLGLSLTSHRPPENIIRNLFWVVFQSCEAERSPVRFHLHKGCRKGLSQLMSHVDYLCSNRDRTPWSLYHCFVYGDLYTRQAVAVSFFLWCLSLIS